jgi:RND superfamily putative drug exporter
MLSGEDPRTGEPFDSSYDGVGAGIEGAEGQFEVGKYLAARMDKNGRLASKGLDKLADASGRLDRGLHKLATGSQRVSDGVVALTRGSEQLSPALERLSRGSERLSGGLDLLETGAGRLADGLAEGARKSGALPRALRRIGGALQEGREGGGGESQLGLLQRRSPGLFHSAYFVLAALDGAQPRTRSALGSLIDLDRGGMDARLVVIPKDPPTTDAAQETTERIEDDAEGLARRTGSEVLVGGVGPVDRDIVNQFEGQATQMRLAMAVVGLLILIPLLGALLVPLFAVVINLLTISATFGIMALLFNGSLLGGPGYIDITTIPSTVMLIFGLAIDYEVFVFARIREEYLRTGSTRQAVERGIERTAPVVSGAAVIMIAVFLSFSVSGLASMRNFGIAQAIAVFIDAFVVRLVIVPALMVWLGDRCWWMPRWLSRRRLSRRSPVPQESG